MNGKQFGISMLFAIILLTVTTAPWSGQQNSASYDPWLDYNEDGKIDVNELYQLGEAYGSTGDSAKNVTIARRATAYLRPGGEHLLIPAGTNWNSTISVDGYETVTVLIWPSSGSSCECSLYACDNDGYSWLIETLYPSSNGWIKTYNVMNQRIQIKIKNIGSTTLTVELALYLVA
jgi:hypothetical protein